MQYPTIGFLYFAGWLGWSGSKYLQEAKKDAKPIEKEIIIDVPLVSPCRDSTVTNCVPGVMRGAAGNSDARGKAPRSCVNFS